MSFRQRFDRFRDLLRPHTGTILSAIRDFTSGSAPIVSRVADTLIKSGTPWGAPQRDTMPPNTNATFGYLPSHVRENTTEWVGQPVQHTYQPSGPVYSLPPLMSNPRTSPVPTSVNLEKTYVDNLAKARAAKAARKAAKEKAERKEAKAMLAAEAARKKAKAKARADEAKGEREEMARKKAKAAKKAKARADEAKGEREAMARKKAKAAMKAKPMKKSKKMARDVQIVV